MSLNEVYKKDPDSCSGSVSPGLSQNDEQHHQDGSLVDIFIQNSRPPNHKNPHGSHRGPIVGGAYQIGAQGPQIGPGHSDQLYLQPPSGEISGRNLSRKGGQNSSRNMHRQSGSFAQLQKERAQQIKNEKIGNFMQRQNEYERRKENNLKKLTKQQYKKERTSDAQSLSINTPRAGNTATKLNNFSGKKASRNSSMSQRRIKNISKLTYDSFEGVKDGVANKMHCDPHSTTSNLALQTISFPGGSNMASMDQQYLNTMNTHPLMQQAPNTVHRQASYPMMVQSHQQLGLQPSHISSTQQYGMGGLTQLPDYYRTTMTNNNLMAAFNQPPTQQQQLPQAAASSDLLLPRPYSVGHQRQVSGGRPVPPHMAQTQATSQAFGMAGIQEEVLDEFPVPSNVHAAPKQTDMSIEQKSFLQMQNAINNMSLRLDDGSIPGGGATFDSQNVTGMMMNALSSGPQGELIIGQGPGMSVTPIRHIEGSNPDLLQHFGQNNNNANANNQSNRYHMMGPSGLGSRVGSNFVSQTNINQQPFSQGQQNQHLETTQIMGRQSNQNGTDRQSMIQKTNSASNFGIVNQNMASSQQQQLAVLQNAFGQQQLNSQMNLNMNMNMIYDNSRGSNGNIAKDIDMLDSEFAQEESRQIEAYYRSVNRESTDGLNNKNSSQNKQSSSLHQPRRSSKRSTRKGINAPLSPPSAKYQKKGGNTNRSMTDRKHKNAGKGGGAAITSNSGIKVGVSRLDSQGINVGSHASSRDNPNQFGGDTSSHHTVNRSQLSRDSQKSARQVNAKAVAQARNHLLRIQEQKRIQEMQKVLNEQKKQMVSAHHKTMRDELYLSNKLTRQFIMVTSLVMQSEDLSEDSIFNYAQYTEFAIRFGLMSERAASEESDERALLYEMWCTLSRVHSDFAFIRVVNLKTMITAILGFPIAVHRNPANMVPKRSKIRSKPQPVKRQQQTQRNLQDDQVIEEGLQESDDEDADENDSEFDQADMEDEVPTENNNSAKNELRASHQHLGLERSVGVGAKEVVITNRDSSQSFDSQSQQQMMMYNNNTAAGYQQQRNHHHEKRASSVIDEQDEFRAAENGQLSSPEESQRQKQNHQQHINHNNNNNFQDEEEEEEQKYFFDQENNNNKVQNADAEQDDQEQDFEDGEGDDESDSVQEGVGTISGDTTSQNEYAIDRAHKIGFFVEHFEFCMSRKDVRTVQRRFKLFHKNWREFQKKDLIVKKSVIVDDGATFMPKINKKSEQLMRNKEQGNIEFPFSTRTDMKSQRRQKIWERELPKGFKSKERVQSIDEFNDDRGEWLTRTEQSTTAGGLPFSKSVVPQNQFQTTRESMEAMNNRKHNRQLNDYFALGQNEQHMHTHSSVISRTSSQGKNSSTASSQGKRKLTYPQMSQRMEHIYQVGRHKMLNRQDNDQNSQDFEKNEDQCTFKPQISDASKQISMRRSFSKEDKPWLIDPAALGQQPQTTRNNMSSQQTQQQLAERMQLSIQKDIMRKKIAQREKQIKDKVINHGGWPKDYQHQQQNQQTNRATKTNNAGNNQQLTAARSQENFKPTFRKYDGKAVGQQKGTNGRGGQSQAAMATMRRSIKSKGQQQQQQSDYPVTTNTSTNLLQQPLSPEMNHRNQQLEINNAHQMQQQLIDHENPAQHQQEQNQDSDGLVTPVNEFTTGRVGAGLGRNLPQTMLLQHLSNANPTPREETPSRGMAMTHMQSLETGGIHHSGDEQGRAPLESQSSVQNVQSTHSASKDQVMATNNSGEQDNGLMTNITMTPTSSSHYNAPPNATHQPSHNNTNNLGQHAVDQLTVIQETTFEQREKGLTSDFISNDTSAQNRKPLLFIEVDTNGAEEGGIERIEVFKGDDPRKLSIDFCKKHDYDEGTQIVLQRQIEDKLARTYAKLEAKMQEKRQNRLAEKFRERQTQKTNKNVAQ